MQEEVLRVDVSDLHDVPCPKTYEETQRSPLKERWDESMRAEWEALLKNQTFEFYQICRLFNKNGTNSERMPARQ